MRKLIFLLFIVFSTLSFLHAQCDEAIELGIEVQDACIGETGSVNLSISGGVPPYLVNVAQSIAPNTALNNLAVGIYPLRIEDAAGCVIDTSFTINKLAGPSIENVSIIDASPTCLGSFNAVITGDAVTIVVTNESGEIVASSFPVTNLVAGRYKIVVEDINGCQEERPVIVDTVETLRIDANNIIHATEECGTSGGDFDLVISGGNPPYAYEYERSISPPLAPGTYNITVTDVGACSADISITILSEGDCERISLSGQIIEDANENCQADIEEIVRPFWPIFVDLVKDSVLDEGKIRIPVDTDTLGIRYTQVDSEQAYQLDFDFGAFWNFEYKYIKLSTTADNGCSTQHYFSIDDFLGGNPLADFQFLVAPFIDCPMLTVDIIAPRLRRGFQNTYYVQYCNYGDKAAEAAYVDVDFDPDVSYLNSSIVADFLSENTYRFNLGSIEGSECGTFTIEVEVSNQSELGQTHCTEAHIYPDAPCISSPDWSGAEIEVDVRCEDDKVIFSVENIGDGPVNDVLFSVVTEELIMMPAPYRIDLNALNRVEYTFPGNGNTYGMEVGQVADFPFPSRPIAIIEGCGTNANGSFSKGIVNNFPQNDYEPYKSIDCQENRSAYDPNDKRGLPRGIYEEHFVELNTDIEYQIRFQNTGTDTAFNVVLLDTLSAYLDWGSIQVGASSHAYEFDRISDNVLRIQFRNILLPDSTTNEVASHGFINFRVSQHHDIPLGSVIENSAAIYFDYNEAIITNTTFHTVDIRFLKTFNFIQSDLSEEVKITVHPNPFELETKIIVTNPKNLPLHFELYDLVGRLLYGTEMPSNELSINRKELNLAAGTYLFRVVSHGHPIGIGKLVVTNED